MTSQLKEKMTAMNVSLRSDNATLDDTGDIVDAQIPKAARVNAKLQEHLNASATSTCMSCAVWVFVTLAFFAMFVVIKIFPKG
jgi:hypothetical protein